MNDLSEKEQLEEMRAWWSENGRFVITGVVLGVAIIFGWNQWRSSIETSRIEASNLFEQVMSAMESGDTEAAEDAAGTLFENYERTVYPAQTRLALARLYMDKGRDQDAVNVLRELIAASDESEIQLVGRLRLAKVLLYQNKPDDVVEILRDRDESGFAARYLEILGDAYATQGNFAEAQTAYLAALSRNSPVPTIDNNLIQLKLNDLPDLTELAAIEVALDEADVAGEPDNDAAAMDEPAGPEAQEDVEPETGTQR